MSAAQQTIAASQQERLADAIERGQEYLLGQQYPEGYWWAELEANVTLTAEYIMLHRILGSSGGTDRERQIRKAMRYLLRQQTANGAWELYYGDGGELSTTVEAYFALKLAGVKADEEPMTRAHAFILARGGLSPPSQQPPAPLCGRPSRPNTTKSPPSASAISRPRRMASTLRS